MNKKLSMLSVLFVDDDKQTLSHAQEVFSLIFNHVFVANDGCDAVNIIETYHPDIIISDFRMPCLNGNEVLNFAKEQIHKNLAILLTAYPDISMITDSINSVHIDAFFVKPINFQLLLEKITELVLAEQRTKEPLHELSPQEQNIFLDTTKGLKPKEIAQKRGLSVKTVSTYKYRILNKLSLKSDIDLIYFAMRKKIIS